MEMQSSPEQLSAVIIATVKCVPHAGVVEASKQRDPAGVLDSSTLVAMDCAGRFLLLETMGKREPDDEWLRRHFWNKSYQSHDDLESPKDVVVGPLASLGLGIWCQSSDGN